MNGFRRLLRYGTVSVISTTVSLAVLGVLVYTAVVAAAWANVIATAVGTVPSFELNRRWVWKQSARRSVLQEVVPFAVMSFAGLLLSTLAVSFAASWANGARLSAGARALVAQLANVSAFGSLWIAQYFVLDRVLFGRAAAPAPEPRPEPRRALELV